MAGPYKRKVRSNNSGILAALLSSRCRAEIFRLLFGLNRHELYVRELARLSGLEPPTVQQELRKLKKLGLVISRRSGNRIYYWGNTVHPLFQDVHRLVIKTVGLVDVLRARLKGSPVEVAFVFGSIARGAETAESDVDLFVVGDLGLREITPLLHGVTEEVFREVNPYALSTAEFAKRVKARDNFVSSVLAAEKLFVVGDNEQLEALGK